MPGFQAGLGDTLFRPEPVLAIHFSWLPMATDFTTLRLRRTMMAAFCGDSRDALNLRQIPSEPTLSSPAGPQIKRWMPAHRFLSVWQPSMARSPTNGNSIMQLFPGRPIFLIQYSIPAQGTPECTKLP